METGAVTHLNGELELVDPVALDELLASADERFEFLVDTFLAGLPDPPGPNEHA